MRFLCDLTNIFNNSTFVPVRVSLFCFFFLFFPQLFDSLRLQKFVRVTYVLFPSSLGEQSEETYRHIGLGDRHSSKCQKVFIVTFDFALPIPSLQLYFNAEFLLLHFTLRCQFLRCSFLSPTPNVFTRCHISLFHQHGSLLLHFSLRCQFLALPIPSLQCSTNVHLYCFLCQLSVHQRFKVFFTTLHCCHQPNGQLITSYLDSSVCSRGSQITSSSHLNWGNVRFPERY